MSKTTKRELIVGQWMDSFTAYMAQETKKILDEQQRVNITREPNAAFKSHLEHLVKGFVLKSLTKKPVLRLSNEEHLKFVSDNFALMKTDIQDAIAKAFQDALGSYAKAQVEYYCQIRTIPPIANKEPC